jgi:hypothetical protein
MSKKELPKVPRPPGKVPDIFRHFEEFVRKVVNVPKEEIDKREADYKAKKKRRET